MKRSELRCPNETDPVAVIDDNEIDRTLIQAIYKRSELPNPLIFFKDGFEFLSYMERVDQGEALQPALILLDINMPGINGFETLRRLREFENFREIPAVIMLTNSSSREDKETSREIGADGFQTKPTDPHEYIRFFNSLMANGGS